MKLKKLFIPLAVVGLAVTMASCGQGEAINSNKEQIEKNQASIAKLSASLTELQKKLEAADEELTKSIAKQIADLKAELISADAVVKAALEKAIADLDEKQSASIKALQDEDTKMSARLSALETLAETFATKEDISGLRETINSIDTTLKARISAIEEVLKGENGTDLKDRFVSIENRLTAAENKITSLEAVVDTLATKEALEQKVATINEQISALDARIEDLEDDPVTKTYLENEIKKITDALGDATDIAVYNDSLEFVEGTLFGRINYIEDRWARFNSDEIANLKANYANKLSTVYTNFDKDIVELRKQAAKILAKNTSLNYKGKNTTDIETDDIYDSEEIKSLLDEVFAKVADQWTHKMQVNLFEGLTKIILAEQAPYFLQDTDEYATDEAIEAYENGEIDEITYLEEGTEITELERIYASYRDLLMSFNDEAEFIVFKEVIKAAISKLSYLNSTHSNYTNEVLVSDEDSSEGVIAVVGSNMNTESLDFIVRSVLDINYELDLTSKTTTQERNNYLMSLGLKLEQWLSIATTLNDNYKYEEESKKLIEAISSVDGATAGKYLSSNEDGYKDQLFAEIDAEIIAEDYLTAATNDDLDLDLEAQLDEILTQDKELMDLVVRRGYGYNTGMIYASQKKNNVNALTYITSNEKTTLGNRFDLDFDDYVELDADNAPIFEFNKSHTSVTISDSTKDGSRLAFDKAVIDLYLEQAIEYNRICGYTKTAVSGEDGINTNVYKNLTDEITRDNVKKTAKEWFVELINSVPNIDNYTIDFELGVDNPETTEVDETETFVDAKARAIDLKDTIADIQYKDDENEVVLYREEAIKYNDVTKVAKEYEKEISDHFSSLSTKEIATSTIYTDLGLGYAQFIKLIENVRVFDNYYKEFAYKDVEQGETPETHTQAFERMFNALLAQYGEAGAIEISGDKADKSGDLEAMALLLYETKAYYGMMQCVFDAGVDIYDIYNHNKHTDLKNETDLVYSRMIGQYKDINSNDLYVEALLDCEAVLDDPDTTEVNESKTTRNLVVELMINNMMYLYSLYTRVYVYNELYNYVRLDYYGVKVTEDTFTTDGSLYKREGAGTDLQPYYYTPITSGTYSSTALYFAKSAYINNIIWELTNMSAGAQDTFINQYDHETDGYIASFDTIASNITSVEGWEEVYVSGRNFIDLTVYNARRFDEVCAYAKSMHLQNKNKDADGYLKYLTDAEIEEFNGLINDCRIINDFLDDKIKVVDNENIYDSDKTKEDQEAAIDLVVFRATKLNEARAYANEKYLVFESKGNEITEEVFNDGTYFTKSGTAYTLATEWVSGTEYFQVKDYFSLRVKDVEDTNNRIISFVLKSEYLSASGIETQTDENAITAVCDADKAAIDLTLELVNEFNKARAYAKSQRDAIDELTKLTIAEKNTDKDKVDVILDTADYAEDESTKIRHINYYIKAKDKATAQGILVDDKTAMELRWYHSCTINNLRIKTENSDVKLDTDCKLIDTIYTAEELDEIYDTDKEPSRIATIKEKVHAYDDFTVEKKSKSEYDAYSTKGEDEISLFTHFAVAEQNILNSVSKSKNDILTGTISQAKLEALECSTVEEAKKVLNTRLLNIYKDTTLISYFDGNPKFNAKTKSGANERQSLASNRILEEIDEYLS